MTDPGIVRLANSVVVPGLCDDALPDWLVDEADRGLQAVCWFSGSALDELRDRLPGVVVLADEEGGNVTRLEAAAGSSWPGNAALGVVDDVTVTERVAAGIATMSRRAGIDVVLGPVVDVNSEPDNPVIGVRSFGGDPELVARHGAAFVRGMQSHGVAACAKHYPGHGATRADSHLELAVVDADLETLRHRDLAPFAAAIAAGVRCVLTAHVVVPAFDDGPATLSAAWMMHLRSELGFDGVVVSDALDMHAIARGVGREAGAVQAMQAGVDLICIGNPCFPEPYAGEPVFTEVRDAIVAAVADRSLAIARIEQAVERVTALSSWLASRPDPGAGVDAELDAARAVGLDAARRAVRSVGDVRLDGPPLVVVEQRTEMAAGRSSSPIVAALTDREPATTSRSIRSADDIAGIEPIGRRPVVLVTDGLAGDAVVQAVRALRRDAIVVHTGPQPGMAVDAPVVYACGNGAANASAVADLLFAGR